MALFLLFSMIAVLFFNIIPVRLRKWYIIAVSFLFYVLCDLRFILLLISEIAFSDFISKKIISSKYKKQYLIIGISVVVIILAFFKYLPLWDGLIGWMCDKNSVISMLIMPLGISYFSFKIISYMIDVYHGEVDPKGLLQDYILYVIFFPQMICGPISRYREIVPQAEGGSGLRTDMIAEGLLLIISGMFKKMVIADRLSGYVDTIWGDPTSYPGIALALAAFSYSVQLYCDFAGYSEMAVGVGYLMGIKILPNFRNPYFASNIREFWKRWHISLTSWLRDYIYIPLGGNRKSKIRKYFNIMAVYFVSGIWHGNRFNFLIWGIYHGILNCLSGRIFSKRVPRCVSVMATFILVTVGWMIFRAEDMDSFICFWRHMCLNFSLDIVSLQAAIFPFTMNYTCLSYFLCTFLAVVFLMIREWREIEHDILSDREKNIWNALYIVFIVLFADSGNSSFLYANF